MNYWKKLVEQGDFTPIDLEISQCDFCKKKSLVEVLSNEKETLRICESCICKPALKEE